MHGEVVRRDGNQVLLVGALGAALAAAAALGAGAWPAAGVAALIAGGLAFSYFVRQRRMETPVESPTAIAPAAQGATDPQLRDLTPLLEALPDPALIVDHEGRIAGSNAAIRKRLAFEASGLRLSSILRHPELLDGAQAAAVDGIGRSVDYQPAGNVEEHWRVYISPIAWGGEGAALMVFHDQTSLIATERMRAEFLTNASHELRTPVAALSLLIETLMGAAKDDPEARGRFLELMGVQAERMRRLIDDLLSLSKIELNEHVQPRERLLVEPILRETVDSVALAADERGTLIEVVAPDPSLTVIGDRFQLQQVLQNLVDNALKYAPAEGGKVRIELGAAPSREEALDKAGRRWPEAGRIALLTPPPSPDRAFIYVRVCDNGRGIARRHLPRLTERFYRVEPQDREERVGTGLGLAIVKHIINRHRGGFCVESVPGEGSAFAVLLERAPDGES